VFAAVAREVADRGAAILCWAVSMNYSFPYEVCCFDDTSFCSLVVGVLTQDVSVLFSWPVVCFAMQLLRSSLGFRRSMEVMVKRPSWCFFDSISGGSR